MKKLLKLEFRKLRTQKSFYICIVIMIAMLFISVLTAKLMNVLSEDIFGEATGGSGIDSVIDAVTSSYFTIIAGIFTVLFVCLDFDQQILKNIYAKGYSRTKVYFAKLITVIIATTVMFLLVNISAFIIGASFFTVGDAGNYKFLALVFTQYLGAMANVILAFAIASVFRKNGASIAAIIVFPLVVNLALSLLDILFKLEKVSLGDFWIASVISDASVLSVSGGRLFACLGIAIGYSCLFTMIGLYFNKKVEL